MKLAGWKLEDKGKRKGQATPQRARQYKKKIQALRKRLEAKGKEAKRPGFRPGLLVG
ncbi:hypothetical protein [Anthocerotibacter panamensis]|uniref:hypothetical protein n=1 Tax=Anthocerotibacter panamensis TaxID=2857077 RepID=UPI001C403B49|nr:hypothetical protein [Anthocerotibacter panamensis]